MVCTKCGAKNENVNFCIECGNTLTQNKILPGFMAGFSWLILAVFILQGEFLPKSILLMLTRNPLSTWWTPVFSILAYAGVILVLLIYLKSTIGMSITKDCFFRGLLSGFSSVLFIWGAFSAFGLVVGNLYKLVIEFGMDAPIKGFMILGGLILLLLILQMILISAIIQLYVSLRYFLNLFQTGKALKITFGWMIKRLPKMLLINICLSLALIAIFFIQDIGINVISTLQPYGFLQTFLKYILSAVLSAGIFLVVFLHAKKMSDEKDTILMQLSQNPKKPIPLLPIISILLGITLLIVYPSQPQDAFEKYTSEIKGIEVRGDIYRDSGYMAAAIREYDIAMSRLLAIQGYLLNRKSLLMQSSGFATDGSNKLKAAYTTDQWNPYISVFQGKFSLENNNPSQSINYLRSGLKNPLFIGESYLSLLKAYKDTKNVVEQKTTLDWLLRNEIFHDTLTSLSKANIKKVNKMLMELDTILFNLEPKLGYKYFEMVSYNAHSEALTGLIPLSEKYKENTELQYMLTQVYAEYRTEQSNYPSLVQATESFSNTFDGSEDPTILLQKNTYIAQMYMMVNDFNKSELVLQKLYTLNPDSIETAQSYMYVLIKNQKFEEGLKLSEKIPVNEKSLTMIYQQALCLLNLGRYSESLIMFKNIELHSETYSEEYDRYLYAFSLAYTNAIKSEEHVSILETELGNSIIKYYILAMKGWRDKNSEASMEQLDIVLNMDKRLGYAWYCQGINFYEQAYRTNSNDFTEAINSYLHALSIIPEHVEGVFSLGHAYNKAGMKLEALRAFRKVIELLPYEDHRVDPYGMVVHAQGEIRRLEQELEQEGQ